MVADLREEGGVHLDGTGPVSSADTEADRAAAESETRPPATFEGAIDALRSTGASVGMRELVELIVQHGTEEGELLATYESLAADSPDAGVRYLVNLILEDEHRHHRLLAELGCALAWGMREQPPVDVVPRLPGAVSGLLLEQTKRLRKAEEEDFRALNRIKRRLRPFADTTLWSLVIDLMLLDTKKHATILRFLERCGNDR